MNEPNQGGEAVEAASAASVTLRDGVGVEEESGSRRFPCLSCGADLEFGIGAQKLVCSFCGATREIDPAGSDPVEEHDYSAMIARVAALRQERQKQAERAQGAAAEVEAKPKAIRCEMCGAVVEFAGTLTSQWCAYCGGAVQLVEGHAGGVGRIGVDGVLAFVVDRAAARSQLAAWVKSRWFAPNAFKRRGVDGKFEGVYLPFWTFDSLTTTHYEGQRGVHYYVTVGSGKNRRTVRRTRWYPASGTFQRFFDDVLVVAAEGVPRARLDALAPWPLKECRGFQPELLAGFLARTYDVGIEEGFAEARSWMDVRIEAEVRSRIGGDVQRIHSIRTRHEAVTYKHLLLPVWMMAYRYGGKSYQVVVNARTGEVQGDRPWSWVKILLTVVAGTAVIYAGIHAFMAMQRQSVVLDGLGLLLNRVCGGYLS